MTTYYQTLGVNRGADIEEIKLCFRRLAMKWHPDRHHSHQDKIIAEEQFKLIKHAYEILGDEKQRRLYDLKFAPLISEHNKSHNFKAWFQQYVNDDQAKADQAKAEQAKADQAKAEQAKADQAKAEQAKAEQPRGANILWKSSISLETAIAGGEIFYPRLQKVTCDLCRGVNTNSCQSCLGKGKLTKTVNTRIMVPPCAVDGSEIIVPNLGKESKYSGGLPGDLHIIFNIKIEKGFKISGLNILGTITVPHSLAIDSGKTPFVLPNGDTCDIQIPKGATLSHENFVLVGQGLKSKDGLVGDVILTVRINCMVY